MEETARGQQDRIEQPLRRVHSALPHHEAQQRVGGPLPAGPGRSVGHIIYQGA